MMNSSFTSGRKAIKKTNAENISAEGVERSKAANAVMALGLAAALVFIVTSVGAGDTEKSENNYANAENGEAISVFAFVKDESVTKTDDKSGEVSFAEKLFVKYGRALGASGE